MLGDFFRLHFPYGFKKINGVWVPFNREFNFISVANEKITNSLETLPTDYSYDPDFCRFLTDKVIKSIVDDPKTQVKYDEQNGEINMFFLYGANDNPADAQSIKEFEQRVNKYLKKLKLLLLYDLCERTPDVVKDCLQIDL